MKRDNTFPLRNDVRLDPLRVKHARAMCAWMKDPVVIRNIGFGKKPTLAGTKHWVRAALQSESTSAFAILRSDRHVGNVVLDRIDGRLGTARLSVYVGESSQRRKGIGSTACYLAIRHGFECLALHKIWLTVHAEHFRAIETYRRLGFSLEGILRGEFLLGERRIPVLYMGLFREDFPAAAGACHGDGEKGLLQRP